MDDLLQHWPFVAAALIFAVFGQVMKTTVFTTENILKYKASKWPAFGEFLWWGKKTLPLHPVLVGAGLAILVPGMPVSPGVVGKAAVALYYAFAGIASTWMFAVLKGIAKERGLELDFDTETIPPKAK